MARGFLGGVVVGGVVSVLGAGIASIVSDPPAAPTIATAALPEAEAPRISESGATDVAPDGAVARETQTPALARPDIDDGAIAEATRSDAPVTPETGSAADLDAPQDANRIGEVDATADTPILPSPQAAIGPAPEPSAPPAIATEPAQPPVVAAPEPEVTPEAEAEPELSSPQVASDDPAPATAPEDTEVAVLVSPEQAAPEAGGTDQEAQTDTPGTPANDVSQAPADEPETSDATDETAAAPVEDTAAQPADNTDPTREAESESATETSRIAALPQATQSAPERPTIGRPAISLVDRTPQVPDAEADPEEAAPADLPPIKAFAAPFDNADDKPLMSIILMDTGVDLTSGPVGVAALRSFPYPLTFAVNALMDDATERAAEYRAQGFEVMALLDLPAGATASDAEVTLSAALDRVPEAVAVLEGVGTGLQDSREASDQVTEALLASGHGLVLQSKGLNTVQKLALREGVPAGLIFRDFDSADQTPTVIRRFLDQAAFRASQEGGVVMVGRLRPDTISALLLWGLQDRAQRVALAPVSAALLTLTEGQAPQ